MQRKADTQTDQIYAQFRRAILTLEIQPGAAVTERELERDFGASRTPVRAALLRLDSEGLVRRHGRGFIVAPLDIDEMRMLSELRESIETTAVRLAVKRASDEDIAALRQLAEEERQISESERVLNASSAFHTQLAQLSGNRLMADAIGSAMARLARTRWLEVQTSHSRENAWSEHLEILDAIESRDADRAVGLVRAHIEGTTARLVNLLSDERQRLRGSGVAVVGSPAPQSHEAPL